jgi:imidazolonepropionase
MRKVTLIRGARQLLTLRGPKGPRRGADLRNLGIIQDGAVLIADGLIREVGPSRRIENLALARGAEEIDASGRVVMPGFVDSHAHLATGGSRVSDYEMRIGGATGEQIARAGGGPVANACAIQELSPRALETLALRALEAAVRHGTTTIEAKSGLGLTDAGEAKILRVHRALGEQGILLISTLFAAQAPGGEATGDAYVERACSHLLPAVRRRKLAEFVEIRCGPGSFTPLQACRYLTTARQLGFGLRWNMGCGANAGVIASAAGMGAVSIGHIAQAAEGDAKLLARSATIATLMPGAMFHRGTERGTAARMLIDHGAAVALATGYHPCDCPSQNMQMTIALACRLLQMTTAEAIAASTINAAHALRRAASIGSIESGKSADLLMLSVPDYRELPYHFGVNLVDFVMSRGAALVERSVVKWPAG